MEKILMQSNFVDVKDLIDPGSSIDIEWEFEGKATDIVGNRTSCGCTANVVIKPGKIIATYTDTKIGTNARLNKQYTVKERMAGFKEYTNSITLYLNDGKPLMKKIGMTETYNKEKENVVVVFKVRVDLSSFPTVKRYTNS